MPTNKQADLDNRIRIARDTLKSSSAKPGTPERAKLVGDVNKFLKGK